MFRKNKHGEVVDYAPEIDEIVIETEEKPRLSKKKKIGIGVAGVGAVAGIASIAKHFINKNEDSSDQAYDMDCPCDESDSYEDDDTVETETD